MGANLGGADLNFANLRNTVLIVAGEVG
ncbi:pentapeptide repeat-containing protein [Thiothrix nivea]